MDTVPRTIRRPLLRKAALLTAAATLTLATACSTDSPIAPVSSGYKTIKTSIDGTLKTLYPMTPLERDVAITSPITRSFTFDRSGGKIEIKETGLRVDVPSGAIPGSSLTITVTALPGRDLAYDFQPHGTVFLKPLSFQQSLDRTSWDKLDFKGTVLGGYFADVSQLDLLDGLALLDELFPVTFDSKNVRFDIKHFSGYMVSSGRQSLSYDSAF
ncbi:MAG: hypothetical protein ABI852_03700 [Gemmatimonadaceae bacterium]